MGRALAKPIIFCHRTLMGFASLYPSYALSGETAGDLFARRKTTARLLRKRQSAIDANFEDAATRPPQAQLRRGSQLKDQFFRLTSARVITSLTAVFDL